MCYNFATFVLYLDVITLIYRENRLTSSETCLSANKLKLSALRWAFFRAEPSGARSCKVLQRKKAQKAIRPLSFNVFSTAPPRRR